MVIVSPILRNTMTTQFIKQISQTRNKAFTVALTTLRWQLHDNTAPTLLSDAIQQLHDKFMEKHCCSQWKTARSFSLMSPSYVTNVIKLRLTLCTGLPPGATPLYSWHPSACTRLFVLMPRHRTSDVPAFDCLFCVWQVSVQVPRLRTSPPGVCTQPWCTRTQSAASQQFAWGHDDRSDDGTFPAQYYTAKQMRFFDFYLNREENVSKC